MARQRYRTPLESGLSINLSRLLKQGIAQPGRFSAGRICWSDNWGQDLGSAVIACEMSDPETGEGWMGIRLGELQQRIIMVSRKRHLGGYQWYLMCPGMNQRCLVLWRPPGASHFACRQNWLRVAYMSQFECPDRRAHRGMNKIKSRLIADLDPADWDLPPKPKWQRWPTYERLAAKYDNYQQFLDGHFYSRAACIAGSV